MRLSDGTFCLRHVLCVCGVFCLDGCFVWLDALFDWMRCSVGCFVWWGSCFFMVGFVCLGGLLSDGLVGGGALYGCGCFAHGVFLFGVMFVFGFDVLLWLRRNLLTWCHKAFMQRMQP